MSGSRNGRSVNADDIVTGIVLAVAGSAALIGALGFDPESRMFPALAAALLAAAGIATIGLGVLRPGEHRRIAHSMGLVAMACMAIAAWAGAFSAGLGFTGPTFLLQISLLLLAGERRPLPLLAVATVVTALAWLVFVFVLDIPLPTSVLPSYLEGF